MLSDNDETFTIEDYGDEDIFDQMKEADEEEAKRRFKSEK